jgi:hypothetical protein
MRCAYRLPDGSECRAWARHDLSRCRWHSFTRLQSQLRAIRASAADTLEECPYRFHREYVKRDAAQTTGVPAEFGNVFHRVVAHDLEAYRHLACLFDEFALLDDVGYEALGNISQEAREQLARCMQWWRRPCKAEQIVFVEPCARSGSAAEPARKWQPLQLQDGTEVWGTPDLVSVGEDGLPTLHDWKTNQQVSDPHGWALVIYAALAEENWPQWAPAAFTWPVRVIWRFVRKGESVGTREVLMHKEDVLRGLATLDGMMAEARQFGTAGEWPATPWNTDGRCKWCPVREECPAPRAPEHEDTASLVNALLLSEAEEYAVAERTKGLRGLLRERAAQGEEVTDEHGGRLFRITTRVAYRGGDLKNGDVEGLKKIVKGHGLALVDALRVGSTADPECDAELAEAGFLKRLEELVIHRNMYRRGGVPLGAPPAQHKEVGVGPRWAGVE